MNWKSKERRSKEVNISFEYTHKSDLTCILTHLRDLIGSGVEMCSGDLESIENSEKYNRFNFVQNYTDTIHESKETKINGELKLVIKSKL